jgi:PKD repeat protein
MSKLWFIPILLMLCIAPVISLSTNLTPVSIAWSGASCGYQNFPASGAIDNDFTTNASWNAGESAGCSKFLHITYPSDTNISGCYITPWGWQQDWNFGRNDNTTGWPGSTFTQGITTNYSFGANSLPLGPSGLMTLHESWVGLSLQELNCYGTPGHAPLANFTAVPTSGPASLYVLLNDASTNLTGSETFNWSISPSTGVVGATSTTKDSSASFATPGNYTVSHGVSNLMGSSIETKVNYITVYNATTDYIISAFAAMDQPRWVQLAGSTINLLDVENGTWKNTSPSALGYETIITKTGHHISAYASMSGYGDADLLSQPAWNGGVYQILMFPTGYNNVTAGNVTLYVNVWDHATSQRLPGATVNMAYNIAGAQYNDYRVTPSSGVATFIVPNKTTIYLYGEKAGYKQAGTTVYSGTGSGGSASVTGDITLIQEYVTTAPTTTAIPTGVPTVCDSTGCHVITVDPYPCIGDGSDSDNANCQRKQTEMASQLIAWGPQLELLFIIATVIGVFKIMTK